MSCYLNMMQHIHGEYMAQKFNDSGSEGGSGGGGSYGTGIRG